MEVFKIFFFPIVILITLVLTTSLVYAQDLKEIKVEDLENIKLEISGAKIIFDKNKENIYLSKELEAVAEGKNLLIESPEVKSWFAKPIKSKYTIIIGSARQYRSIELKAGGADLSGALFTEKLSIQVGGINSDLEIIAREVEVSGAGVNFRGQIEAEQISFNGAGMDVDIAVLGTEEMKLRGAGMDVRLKYLDAWEGLRYLEARGIGGKLEVLVPSHNESDEDGKLDVATDGFIKVVVRHY